MLFQQAKQYEDDFKQERQDRQTAAGQRVDDDVKVSLKFQELHYELSRSQELYEAERQEKLAALEAYVSIRSQLDQAVASLEIKRNDLKVIVKDNDELRVQIAQLTSAHEQRLVELGLEKQAAVDRLNAVANAEKCKLQEKLDEMLKLQEKQLEIAASEKLFMKEELEREIAQAKATSGRLGMELQDTRERLDTAIADTANLSDEVMAKTVQVKQYNKQTESYRTKVEETNSELQRTQQETEQYCQSQVKILVIIAAHYNIFGFTV